MKKTPLERMHGMVERFNSDLVGIDIPAEPTILRVDRANFRIKHMEEELQEAIDGFNSDDLEEATDGLIDLTYVALGALVEMGICVGGVFEEVHDANMAKVRGINPKRPTDTVAKPEGWKPPNLWPYLTVTKKDLERITDEKIMHKAVGDHPESVRMVGASRGRRKVLVMGYARHGKDTAAEMIAQRYGLKFTSSSMFLAERLMMGEFPSGTYQTVEECFEDRGNHRQKWYEAIRDFNRPDASALGRAIFAEHDIYCGIRSRAEFHAMKNSGVFDISVWIDAQDRGVPPEANESCTVRPWMADYVVDNGGDQEQLHHNIKQLLDGKMA